MKIHDSIDNATIDFPLRVNKTWPDFKFILMSTNRLFKLVTKMKNKRDINGVNAKMIIDSWPMIGDTLCTIVNRSFVTGDFPEAWKTAVVVPVEKVKKSTLCSNFRPINMMNTTEKILEVAAKNQFVDFIERNGILVDEQSGSDTGIRVRLHLTSLLLIGRGL